MMLAITKKTLKHFEGWSSTPYPDPKTKAEPFTFGFGFTYISVDHANWIREKRKNTLLETIKKEHPAIGVKDIVLEDKEFNRKVIKNPSFIGGYLFGYDFEYILKDEAEYILEQKILKMDKFLNERYSWYKDLSDLRKMVIVNLCFQLGADGFYGFRNTRRYLADKKYVEASKEMLDSVWYRQMHDLDMADGVDEENRAEWLSWVMANDKYRDRKVS